MTSTPVEALLDQTLKTICEYGSAEYAAGLARAHEHHAARAGADAAARSYRDEADQHAVSAAAAFDRIRALLKGIGHTAGGAA